MVKGIDGTGITYSQAVVFAFPVVGIFATAWKLHTLRDTPLPGSLRAMRANMHPIHFEPKKPAPPSSDTSSSHGSGDGDLNGSHFDGSAARAGDLLDVDSPRAAHAVKHQPQPVQPEAAAPMILNPERFKPQRSDTLVAINVEKQEGTNKTERIYLICGIISSLFTMAVMCSLLGFDAFGWGLGWHYSVCAIPVVTLTAYFYGLHVHHKQNSGRT